MNCREAQAMITAFINDQLDISALEEFIGHINTCKECKEELEVYYAMMTAMRQLDEDQELTDNFKQELEKKLKRVEDRIRHNRRVKRHKQLFLFLMILCFGVVLSIQFGENVVPETPITEQTLKPPSFALGIKIVPKRYDFAAAFVEEYHQRVVVYLYEQKKSRENRDKILSWDWKTSYFFGGNHGESREK